VVVLRVVGVSGGIVGGGRYGTHGPAGL